MLLINCNDNRKLFFRIEKFHYKSSRNFFCTGSRSLFGLNFLFFIIFFLILLSKELNLIFQNNIIIITNLQESISNLKGSDDISKFLKIIEVTLQDNTIIQDYKDIFTKDKLSTVKALGSFIKTAKWDKWTEQHNIPPGIIGIIEEIFKKTEELESKKFKLDPKKKEQV